MSSLDPLRRHERKLSLFSSFASSLYKEKKDEWLPSILDRLKELRQNQQNFSPFTFLGKLHRCEVTAKDKIDFAIEMIKFFGLSRPCRKAVKKYIAKQYEDALTEWRDVGKQRTALKNKSEKKKLKDKKKKLKNQLDGWRDLRDICQRINPLFCAVISHQGHNYDKLIRLLRAREDSLYQFLEPKETAAALKKQIDKWTLDRNGGGLGERVFEAVKECNFQSFSDEDISNLFKMNALVFESKNKNKWVYLTWIKGIKYWKDQEDPQWIVNIFKQREDALKAENFFSDVASHLSFDRKQWPFNEFVSFSFREMIWIWTLQAVLGYLFNIKEQSKTVVIGLYNNLVGAIRLGHLKNVFSEKQRFSSLCKISKQWRRKGLVTFDRKEDLVLYNTFLLIKQLISRIPQDNDNKIKIMCDIVKWAFYHNSDPSDILPLPSSFSVLKFHKTISDLEALCLNRLSQDRKIVWRIAIRLLTLATFHGCKEDNISNSIKKLVDGYFQVLKKESKNERKESDDDEKYDEEEESVQLTQEDSEICIQFVLQCISNPNWTPWALLRKLAKKFPPQDVTVFLKEVLEEKQEKKICDEAV